MAKVSSKPLAAMINGQFGGEQHGHESFIQRNAKKPPQMEKAEKSEADANNDDDLRQVQARKPAFSPLPAIVIDTKKVSMRQSSR